MNDATSPLTLPPDFDPDAQLPAVQTDEGIRHQSRAGAALAANLVANGTPQDLERADAVLHAVLRCQKTNPRDPHHGNFTWMAEDDAVEDLNAVQFNLEHLIPMMIRHRDRLSAGTTGAVMQAIRLGLAEIARLDVLPAYTNITALDILNQCLGGELLEDPGVSQRGYGKLVLWMQFTDANGHPFEYNSPTYTAVTIRALTRLASLVRHGDTRIRARTMATRLALSVALHIHPRTERWAGPHSRAYHPTVVCETEPEIEMLRRWVRDGAVSPLVLDTVECRPERAYVVETAFAERNMGLSTFHGSSYSFGVATTGFGGQSNVMLVHGHRPDADRPGVMYTRYLTNDKWLGDFYHATDRSRSRNLLDEGQFYGVQDGSRAVGLYAPGRLDRVSSAKTAIVWTNRSAADELWIGDRRGEGVPAGVPDGAPVVVGCGEADTALRPLSRTPLGADAPARLVRHGEDVVLELYNYRGPAKRFWELGWPGAFYKGRPYCAVYVECADRSEYASGAEFARTVAAGEADVSVAAPFTYAGVGTRSARFEYRRDGRAVGVEVELMEWRLQRRWTHDGELGWPMLDSPVAAQSRDGRLQVGGAVLEWGGGPAWLAGCPVRNRWLAAYSGTEPVAVTLRVPGARVDVEAMAAGTLEYDNGEVRVEAVGLRGEPRVVTSSGDSTA